MSADGPGEVRSAAEPGARDSVIAGAHAAIAKGSKSFATASRLFDAETRDDVVMLYAWCRHCDDVVDGQELGFGAPGSAASDVEAGSDAAEARVEALRRDTRAALAGRPPAQGPGAAAFAALARVAAKHRLPEAEPLDLIDGFAMDAAERRYQSLADTLDYAYHVAGVVGVMMARVMGVRDEATLDRACDLGLAFQLTNIARDVLDDARGGRTYLPAEWLAAEGIERIDPANAAQRPALHRVASRLVDEAEPYYASARIGIRALRFRSAWSIATAARVYRAIGVKVRAAGPDRLLARQGTSKAEKSALLALALGDALRSRAERGDPPRAGLWTRPRGA